MVVGDKLETHVIIEEITDIIPVVHKDDGEEDFWEVTDSSDNMAIIGKDISGNEVTVIINKESELITDLL